MASLNDDLIKLVRYWIATVEPGRERLIDQGEQIVSDNLSDAAFTAWVVSSYLRSVDCRGSELPAMKYLRVGYQVRCGWPQQEQNDEQEQADALYAILGTLRDRCALGTTPQTAEQTGAGGQQLGPANGRFDVSSFDSAETFE